MRYALTTIAAVTTLSSLAFAQSRVIITEIMYNPASNEKNGETEWIEIANVGNEAAELKDWTLKIDGKKTKWGSFNCTLAPGAVAVLVNSKSVTAEQFRAAWDTESSSSTYQVIGVTWGALANNPGDNALQLIDDKGAVICEVKQNKDWPRVNGAGGPSIFLADFSSTSLNDGALWRIAQAGLDGARQSKTTETFDKADTGSPGYVPGLNGNPSSTTPAKATKEKKKKEQEQPDDAKGNSTQATGSSSNKIDY